MSEGESKSEQIMLLNDNKAGMEGLDKDSINRIIYEASKGSLFFENEQKKEASLKKKIEEQLKQVKETTPEQIITSITKAEKIVESLERERDLSRVIVHIDMDAFYAAVEILSRPDLKDHPMAVGSNHMLSTSNYAARRFGVRAGMPGFIAKKLCPQLAILPLNFSEYRRYSTLFGKVLSEYDPNYSKMGLDEAYLDITEYLIERSRHEHREIGGEIIIRAELESEVVNEMRQKIFQLTNLTSSAGIAPNGMLAKVCSDINKPNGQFRIERTKEAVLEFIRDLPIRKISGFGKVSEQMLKSLDIQTCVQLLEKKSLLHQLYSTTSFEHFIRVGLGVGCGRVERDSERKSMSIERTFEDTSDIKQLTGICHDLCRSLVDDLTDENLAVKTITLKVKEITFQVKTRAKTLTYFTQSYDVIFEAAVNLLKIEIKNSNGLLKLRLMGVRASTLMSSFKVPRSTQRSLYEMLKVQNNKDGGAGVDNDSSKILSEDVPSSSTSPADATYSLMNNNHNHNNLLNISDDDDDDDEFKVSYDNNDSSIPVATNNIVVKQMNDDDDDHKMAIEGALCPVCFKHLPSNDDVIVNKHLDDCLSMTYIKQELKHSIRTGCDNHDNDVDKKIQNSPSKKSSFLATDSNHNGRDGQSSNPSLQQSPTKEAINTRAQKRKKPSSPQKNTLMKFFRLY